MPSLCCKIATISIIAGCVIVIVLSSVLAASVQFVSTNHVGLLINTYTNFVYLDKVYDEGRYFNGPGHEFLEFPKFLKTISWIDSGAISTQTLDGLPLRLDVTLQYKIIAQEVPELFSSLLRGYETTLKTVADAAIRKTASLYRAVDFFYNRTAIGQACHVAVNDTLLKQHVTVPFFQMRRIDLPDSFEDALVTTEVERQGVQTKTFQQQSATIRAQKAMIDATTDALIQMIWAATTANVTLISKQAEADATKIDMQSRADANEYLMRQLNFNGTHLLKYLYVDQLRLSPQTKLLVNLKTALVSQP